jgi:1-pyrroline-5-carboxylate dehydrogenase
VRDFRNFVSAVIKRESYDRQVAAIAAARADGVAVIAGGQADDAVGWFVRPTLLRVDDPTYRTMHVELFGPVVSLYVYPDHQWPQVLELVDQTSQYGLTGAVFATDRYAIDTARAALRHAAGNFYINDKPTGAVVGQQPFGGARASGTDDKSGAAFHLLRWVAARTIKETFAPPTDYRYPFLAPDPPQAGSA